MADTKKRVPFNKQREICREAKTAYYENISIEGEILLSPGGSSPSRLLMCGMHNLRGGQCMPVKCKDMRVIKESDGTERTEGSD